jgi:hypothetical protein
MDIPGLIARCEKLLVKYAPVGYNSDWEGPIEVTVPMEFEDLRDLLTLARRHSIREEDARAATRMLKAAGYEMPPILAQDLRQQQAVKTGGEYNED